MRKRKFNVLDLCLSVLFTLILSIYIIPFGLSYSINFKNELSNYTKHNILLASKEYFNNNKDANSVSIRELIKGGYLEDKEELNQKECYTLISNVVKLKEDNKYYLNLKCAYDESILVLAK